MSRETRDLIGDEFEYLTAFGKLATRRLIREELRKLKDEARQDIAWERQQTQWTLTKVGLIIGWVLGALGIVIALFKRH